MIVVPAVDLIGGECVRLHRGAYGKKTVYCKDPIRQARVFDQAGFTRLHVVDLEGARDGVATNRRIVKRMAESVPLSLQAGGGIREASDVKELLESGVRQLIVGTVALEQPDRLSDWIARWGADRFICGLDLRGGAAYSRGWLRPIPYEIEALLEMQRALGLTTFICTDIERDGTLGEPNFPLYRRIRQILPAPIQLIAAGGISRPDHLVRLQDAGVDGAVVGKALYEGDFPLSDWLPSEVG